VEDGKSGREGQRCNIRVLIEIWMEIGRWRGEEKVGEREVACTRMEHLLGF
jgi:hypothetical protein